MFNEFIHAARLVTELLRFRDIAQTNDKTQLLYALVSDNYPLFCRLQNGSESTNLQNEIGVFLNNRVIFLLNVIIDKIIKHFNLETYLATKVQNSNINGSIYGNDNILALKDLQKLEYDVDQIINISNHTDKVINHSDETYYLNESTMFDRINILVFLIQHFQYACLRNQVTEMKDSSKYILNNIEDVSSIRCLVVYGYLISKVAYALAESEVSFDIVRIKETKLALIKAKYTELTSLGSMSIPNTLCCFANFDFMKFAIENTSGSSSHDTRTILFNLLVIAKITKKLFN